MFKKLQMKMILKKVENGLIYAKDSAAEGVFVIDKKALRVKVQYNKIKDEYFFTVHRLTKNKSWNYVKYLYDANTKQYSIVREGTYTWNTKA